MLVCCAWISRARLILNRPEFAVLRLSSYTRKNIIWVFSYTIDVTAMSDKFQKYTDCQKICKNYIFNSASASVRR